MSWLAYVTISPKIYLLPDLQMFHVPLKAPTIQLLQYTCTGPEVLARVLGTVIIYHRYDHYL